MTDRFRWSFSEEWLSSRAPADRRRLCLTSTGAPMRLKVSRTFDLSAEELRDVLDDPDYYRRVVDAARALSSARTLETAPSETRVRFTAPTQLPRLLKRYADKAPREVHWDEILRWDDDRRTAVFDVEPHVPDHWHEKYSSDGTMEIVAQPDGRATLQIDLDFSLNVGFVGRAIEKLLQKEIEALLQQRLDIIQTFVVDRTA